MKTFFILSFVLFCNLLCRANTNNRLSHQANNPINITTIYQYFKEQGMLKLPISYDTNFNKEIALLKRKRKIARAVYPYRIPNSPFYVNVNKKNTTHNDTETSIQFLFEETNGNYILGIIGAVLGLIQVMQNLSDPSKLGAGIAVAFVATVYGVGGANLILIPFSTKLKTKFKKVFLKKEMIIEGILSIQAGESPALIERKLQAYILDSHMRLEE